MARRIREKAAAGSSGVGYAESFEGAVAAATVNAHEGDMILTLGAGSVSQFGPMLLEKLQAGITASQSGG